MIICISGYPTRCFGVAAISHFVGSASVVLIYSGEGTSGGIGISFISQVSVPILHTNVVSLVHARDGGASK